MQKLTKLDIMPVVRYKHNDSVYKLAMIVNFSKERRPESLYTISDQLHRIPSDFLMILEISMLAATSLYCAKESANDHSELSATAHIPPMPLKREKSPTYRAKHLK